MAHRLDLRNLLGGRAEKAEQGLRKRLVEQAKSWKGVYRLRESLVASPRKRVDESRPISIEAQILRDRSFLNIAGLGDAISDEIGGFPLETNDAVGPEALPNGLAIDTRPPKRLPSFEGFAERFKG